jgi:DNA-binding CsgD family transcriptional regulator
MPHLVFVCTILALFTCLLALCLVIVAIIVRGWDRMDGRRLPLLCSFVLFLLSFGADLYIRNLSLGQQSWVYELQEILLVLLIPAFAILANAAFRPAVRRPVNAAFGCFAGVVAVAYVYGNFVNTALWPVTYTIYGLGALLTLLYGSIVLLLRPDLGNRVPAVLTLVLLTGLVLSETGVTPPVTSLLLPLIALVWGGAIVLEELARYVRASSPVKAFNLQSAAADFHLSEREQEVTGLLLAGKRYEEIGEALFISKATVKTYVFRVYGKLEVNSKMELVNKLLRRR